MHMAYDSFPVGGTEEISADWGGARLVLGAALPANIQLHPQAPLFLETEYNIKAKKYKQSWCCITPCQSISGQKKYF